MYTSIGESRLSTKHHLRLEDDKIIAREEHCQRQNIREVLEIINGWLTFYAMQAPPTQVKQIKILLILDNAELNT